MGGWQGGGGISSQSATCTGCYFVCKAVKNKQPPKKQVNKKRSTLRECIWCLVCVCSRRGRDSGVQLCQYSSVSTALVVVNTGSFVSDL